MSWLAGILASIIVMQPWPMPEYAPVPVARWTCDDNAASTVVLDAMGSYNATATANTNTLDTAGVIGGALALGGSNYFYETQASGALWNEWPDSFTICVRINRAVTTTNQAVFCKTSATDNTNTNDYFMIQGQSDGTVRIAGRSDNVLMTDLVTTNTTSASTWYHIAVVVTPEGRAIYWNKAPHVSDEYTTRPRDAGAEAQSRAMTWGALWGATLNSSSRFNGSLDQCEVYNVALTAEQIAALP